MYASIALQSNSAQSNVVQAKSVPEIFINPMKLGDEIIVKIK